MLTNRISRTTSTGRQLRFMVSLLVLSLLSCDKSPTETDDDNPFLGTWRLTHFQGSTTVPSVTWIFTRDSVTVLTGPDTRMGTYSFDATTNPPSLDVSFSGLVPDPNLAIYELPSSTTMLLKFMDEATTRATNFSVEPGYILQQYSKP
jgi:hypothetical protein